MISCNNKISSLNRNDNLKNFKNEEIHTWFFNINQSMVVVKNFYRILSAEEKYKISKIRIEELRNRQIITKGTLRVLLSNYFDCEPLDIEFQTNNYGKPEVIPLLNTPNISFNLSHSEDYLIVGLTKDHLFGIDLEKIVEIQNLDDVVGLCFSEYEKKWFRNLQPLQRPEIFYKIWTAKEAFIKAIGEGLSFSPNRISFDINPVKELKLNNILWEKDTENWQITSFHPVKNTVSTIAANDKNLRLVHLTANPSDLIQAFN
jgi:4'-phosphopantetheinyl transferase